MIFLLLAGQYEFPAPALRDPARHKPIANFRCGWVVGLRGLALDIFGQIGLLLLVGWRPRTRSCSYPSRRSAASGGGRPHGGPVCGALAHAPDPHDLVLRFIMGSIPLAIASGAGRMPVSSMGTVVIGGLIVATSSTLFITSPRPSTSPSSACSAQTNTPLRQIRAKKVAFNRPN